ncbi:MAG: OmpA family protein, partial [Myxococcota bacterium]
GVFCFLNSPLFLFFYAGELLELPPDVLQTNLIGGYVYKQIRAGIDVPLYLLASGENGAGTGLGDVALDVKGTVLRADQFPVALALGGRLNVPTATSDAPIASDGASGDLQLIASQRYGALTVAANLGSRFVPETILDNVDWNDQFFYRAGAGYEIIEDVGASFDLAGQLVYGEPIRNNAASPAEFLIGGWVRLFEDYMLRAGAGSGLNQGVGAPDARVILAVSYEPAKITDRDLDGIVDKDDACPDTPEDIDQYSDADGCPDPSTAVFVQIVDSDGEVVPGVVARMDSGEYGGAFDLSLHPGEYQISAEAERFASIAAAITVPQAPRHDVRLQMEMLLGTLAVQVQDPDGAPLDARLFVGEDSLDFTGTGELDVPPEVNVVRVSADGYKSQEVDIEIIVGEVTRVELVLEPSRARVSKEKIEILDKVFFDTAKTTIKAESFGLLDDVANILQDNPDIRKLRVEGHTDSRGSATYNRELSQGRAAAVVDYLVSKGISRDRLQSQGFGEDRPLDSRRTRAAYSKNRRVEFVILERDGFESQP